jgi:glycosyltransferase involved in cell wall biosynthesis
MPLLSSPAKLRVLHVVTGLEIGGAERVLLEMVRHQVRRGYQVEVCSLRPEGPLAPEVRAICPLITLGMGHALTPLVLWRLERLMRRGRYDVVHSTLYQADVATRIAGRLAGIPVNVSLVQCSYTWLRWYHFLVDRWTARMSDGVMVVSEATRRFSLERERLPANKVVTLRNAINLDRFDAITDRAATSSEVRAALGYSASEVLICVVGRLHPQKGHTYLFQALQRLRRQFPALRLLVVGDGPLRAALEAECQERGLADIVQFLGMRQDVPQLLAACDIFCLPSLYEGLPLVVLEAMAMRCPIVATAVDGTAEAIEDEQQGLLVPAADVQALEGALQRLLSDPALGSALAEAGRRRVVAEFSFERMMQETEALYAHYLARKAPGHLSLSPALKTVVQGENAWREAEGQ